mmetsp:Transcript_20702/g.28660  ORF Transcript_20702/g.28660 Transcript_20702/m.28660 type:complete len:125 (-) Transcript_20702:71-445(-)|eukprot:CAMPEP_0196579406 /NCGR_PEP_ID=MMETSP1081-20130531/21630_1 /TAXON_ID=36882 /ORGANISM="Pyramimonas amylifera, Strain CCMP720" /LENGTH=124 /DNA_ID=CAMNT_0041898987 /DNA_START=58 /DNA_END=432 /DNA_ORIENTATION=+
MSNPFAVWRTLRQAWKEFNNYGMAELKTIHKQRAELENSMKELEAMQELRKKHQEEGTLTALRSTLEELRKIEANAQKQEARVEALFNPLEQNAQMLKNGGLSTAANKPVQSRNNVDTNSQKWT